MMMGTPLTGSDLEDEEEKFADGFDFLELRRAPSLFSSFEQVPTPTQGGSKAWSEKYLHLGVYRRSAYPNNGVYEGEWKGNKRHGIGTLSDSSGIKYEGEWKDDKKNGRGTYTYGCGMYGTLSDPPEFKYEGEWKEDQFYGRGTLTYSTGDKYEGEWKEDFMHGAGVYTVFSGTNVVKFDGLWDYFKGSGTVISNEGTVQCKWVYGLFGTPEIVP